MTNLTSQDAVSFVLMPVNNDRTAWAPFGLPVLLVVPHRRDALGNALPNSGVSCVKVYVADVPHASYVVGQDHIVRSQPTDFCDNPIPGSPVTVGQLRWPNNELYSETVSVTQLSGMQIQMQAVDYFRLVGTVYQPILQSQATYGDFIQYTANSGVTDFIPFLPDADYFDFSGIELVVEPLPSGHYTLVYQCEYFTRSTSKYGSQQLLCIDTSTIALALLQFPFNHPGEVIDDFSRLTPAVYLSSVNKSQDPTLQLYRPLTDSLQDIYDEQALLRGVNWIYKLPAQYLPYLSQLLGWDFPFYPSSSDDLKRVLLLNTSWLQTVKGSRAAVEQMFQILGIQAVLANLWWSADGKMLIRPGDALPAPYQQEEIGVSGAYQCELLLGDYQTSGNGQLTIPLLYRPQTEGGLDGFTGLVDGGDVYLNCFLVSTGSDAYHYLQGLMTGGTGGVGIAQDPTTFSAQHQTESVLLFSGIDHTFQRDFLVDATLYTQLDGRTHDLIPTPKLAGIGSYSQIRITDNQQGSLASGILGFTASQATYSDWAPPPLVTTGVTFDRVSNNFSINFNGYIDFSGRSDLPLEQFSRALFVFAAYTRPELQVPAALTNLQSNWFDIQLLEASVTPPLAGNYAYINPSLLDFALEFLNKVKAFHSLLNVIQFVIELNETHETTDICLGGNIEQRYDTMMGRLQVPPAIIPKIPGESNCEQLDPESLGYKLSDIVYRLRVLTNLPEEFNSWQALDDRNRPEVYSVTGTRLKPMPAAPGRSECYYTPRGQDRNPVEAHRELSDREFGPGPNAGQSTLNADKSPNVSPAQLLAPGVFSPIGDQTCTNSDSSEFGSFTRQYDDYKDPWCQTDGSTDYCYKGRVSDQLLYQAAQLQKETYRNRIRGLTLGTGVYWVYYAISRELILGTAAPVAGSLTTRPVNTGNARVAYTPNYRNFNTPQGRKQSAYLQVDYDQPIPYEQDTFLGKLLQAYGDPRTQSLHFGNNIIPPHNLDQTNRLSILRPELDVQKGTLHFPGCRLMGLGALAADFKSSDWKAKPWDDEYSLLGILPGRGGCCQEPTWLGASLQLDDAGNEILVYPDKAYALKGNLLIPDVPSLSDHTATPLHLHKIVHAVYSTTSEGHPAITLEGVDSATQFGVAPVIAVTGPLFDTYNTCYDALNRPFMVDFCDGYSSSTGIVQLTPELENRNGVTFDDTPTFAIFLLGDGILEGVGSRLDLHCNLLSCSGLTPAPEVLPQIAHSDSKFGKPIALACDHMRPQSSGQSFLYNGFADSTALTMNGTATDFQPNSSQSAIVLRLTSATTNQRGSFYLTTPVALSDDDAFSTYFQFQLLNPGGISDADGPGGSGLAFILQGQANNALGAGLGYGGITPSVAIEFDTFNHGALDHSDGNHVGVNVNGNLLSIALVKEPVRFNNGAIWNAWIDYDGAQAILEVRWSQTTNRPLAPNLSTSLVLVDILGSTSAFAGFAASTDASYESHDIRYWKLVSAFQPLGVYTVSVLANAPSGTVAANTSITISGQAESTSSLDGSTRPITAVTVNGVAVDTLGPNGAFSTQVIAVHGTNALQVVATDSGGISAQATVTVVGILVRPPANQPPPTEFVDFVVQPFGCDLNLYTDENGCIDPSEDRVRLIPVLAMDEPYGGAAVLLDGTIPTLFELLPSCPGGNGVTVLASLAGEGPRCYTPVPVAVAGTWVQ